MQSKFFVSVILITICGYHSNAQSLAVNTDGSTANASALLDVKSNTKGILIPRMTRAERDAITTPATGLLIFQTAPDSVGFHYYDGSKWTWIFSNSNADSLAWRTKGNTGTSAASNFVGTKDNVPLVIRANDIEQMRITPNGELALGTSTPNSTYGTAKLELASEGYGTPADILIRNAVSNCCYAPGLSFQHARGTLASPLPVINGDYISATVSMAYDGTNYLWGTGIDSYVDGPVSAGHIPTNMNFYTSSTTAQFANRMTIKNDGKIGIGTTAPLARTHISGGNFLVDGVFGTDSTLAFSGTGTRMFFYPRKAALRAGIVSGTLWDDANIGNFSVGLGLNAQAKTDHSVSIGEGNIAETNQYAIAIGRENHSTGFAALAMGHFSEAAGDYSVSAGLRDTVAGFGATALGGYNKVTSSSNYGFAAGENNTVSGLRGFATGYGNIVTANGAATLGLQNTASGTGAFAAGNSNIASGIYSIALGNASQAKTSFSIAIGDANIAETGAYAAAIGRQNHSTGFASLAMGHFSEATGDYSVSAGLRDTVSGFGASSMGSNNKVSSTFGFAAGFSNTVAGTSSMAVGNNNFAPSFGETTIGNFATQYTALSAGGVNFADRVFTIGNGTGTGSRSDAMVVLKNGNTGIGTATPSAKLHIGGGTRFTVLDTGSIFLQSGNTIGSARDWKIAVTLPNGYLSFRDMGFDNTGTGAMATDAMVMAWGTGNVGIATPTPAARLDVAADFKLGASGTVNNALIKTTQNIDVGSIAANSELDVTVAVANANTSNSAVFVSPVADIEPGIVIAWARVSAANTVKIRFRNTTGSAIDPAAINYVISVLQ